MREVYDLCKSNGSDVGTYLEFCKWCKERGEDGRRNRKKLYDVLVSNGEYNSTFASFCSRLGINTLRDEYDELRRISKETNWNLGIEKYTFEQFCKKYGTKSGLLDLYDVLSRISEETGIDFNLGNKEEWLSSFETDNYNNTQL